MLKHNDAMQIGLTRPVPDALAFEYKRDYGTALGNLDIADFVNNPAVNGECSVFRLGFPEERPDLLGGKIRPFLKNPADAFLVGQDSF